MVTSGTWVPSCRMTYVASLARKRMAVMVLFRDCGERILLVNPTYKDTWLLPGGAVEAK